MSVQISGVAAVLPSARSQWVRRRAFDTVFDTPDSSGRSVADLHTIAGVGAICMFKDPVGALIYVMQPEEAPEE